MLYWSEFILANSVQIIAAAAPSLIVQEVQSNAQVAMIFIHCKTISVCTM